MKIQKKDANGNPIFDANGSPVFIEVADSEVTQNVEQVVARVDVDQIRREAADKARSEEKRKQYDELERVRAERAELAAKLEAREKADKERALSQLPVDQQIQSRLQTFEQELAKERAERAALEARSQQQLRAMSLVAYRERATREVPVEVADLVDGHSEEEIDRSVDVAKSTYSRLQDHFFSAFSSSQAPATPQYVEAPPPNPAYVSTPYYTDGFPTSVNPVPVTEGQPSIDMAEMTTEQAVRSGRYGGEMRERIHAQLKGASYKGQIGSAPRHWSQQAQQPLQHTAMPGDVYQPQGTPMGPVNPPSRQQMQAPQQQQSQGMQTPYTAAPVSVADARAKGRHAIERTHAGSNPAVNGDSMVSTALNTAQKFSQDRGITPQKAFSSRFTPTPPVSSGGSH